MPIFVAEYRQEEHVCMWIIDKATVYYKEVFLIG